MSAAQAVGDRHRGQWLPFWMQACERGRPYALPSLGGADSPATVGLDLDGLATSTAFSIQPAIRP